jgi:hypothetical protein
VLPSVASSPRRPSSLTGLVLISSAMVHLRERVNERPTAGGSCI